MAQQYKNIAALAEAVKKKELTGTMYIDNDDVYFVSDEENEKQFIQGGDAQECYSGGMPVDVLKEALIALGISWEDV